MTAEAQNGRSVAYIGNGSAWTTSGGATGDITINAAGAVNVESLSGDSRAIIGDGGSNLYTLGWANYGPTGGTITIDAGSLNLDAPTNSFQSGQARIANRGQGSVGGNININTVGDIDIHAGDGTVAGIGDGTQSTAIAPSGNVDVQSGGNIALNSTGTGEARIAVTFGTNSNITVTAVGNITLATAADADGTTTGGTAFMGSFGDGAVALGGNVAVTSTGGAIALNAGEDQSLAAIGNQSGTPATSGNLTVSAANGTITLDASGNAAQAIIGNLSQGFGAASGDITIVSGNALDITATNTNAVPRSAMAALGSPTPRAATSS